MAAAEHGADFPMAQKLRKTMTHDQLHDFAVGPMANKPEHIAQTPDPNTQALPLPPRPSIIMGNGAGVLGANTKSFKNAGMNEFDATKSAIQTARKSNHGNLGKFLHPRKDGKPHGSAK
jgi:hypothetical protein